MKTTKRNGGEENYPAFKEPLSITSCACEEGQLHPLDYGKLNSVMHKDANPLACIDDTLQSLSDSKWFSTIDLLSGYWQVDIAEDDKEKTAFTTHDGLFEINAMPFGLCNVPATFQRLMNLQACYGVNAWFA